MTQTTSVHLGGGYHLHITWDGNQGVDQHGNKWVNPNNPEMENKLLEKTISAMFGGIAAAFNAQTKN